MNLPNTNYNVMNVIVHYVATKKKCFTFALPP